MPQAESELEIHLPDTSGLDQDQEWCEVEIDGERRRIRFHDYHEVYGVPGLYEALFYGTLRCDSPRTIRRLLAAELDAEGFEPSSLRVLDIGAGNGMVGEELEALGVDTLVGVDIIPEAKEAALRDRPGLYDEYVVADLTDLDAGQRAAIERAKPNCLTCVAALGFGDIPPRALAESLNFVSDRGWVAFNIKEDFLADADPTGFNLLIRRLLDERHLVPLTQTRYRHRLSASGKPLLYEAFVAQKRGGVPEQWLLDIEATTV